MFQKRIAPSVPATALVPCSIAKCSVAFGSDDPSLKLEPGAEGKSISTPSPSSDAVSCPQRPASIAAAKTTAAALRWTLPAPITSPVQRRRNLYASLPSRVQRVISHGALDLPTAKNKHPPPRRLR